jgi:co-chaperonin GroES (HSP10)
MKAVFFVFLMFSLIFTGNLFAQEKLGNELTLEEVTSISDIISNLDEYLGKKVLVEGEVLDVCKHMGCWMDLSGDTEGQKIKIKVKDGEIIFTEDFLGRTALAEGEVYAIEMDEEEAK